MMVTEERETIVRKPTTNKFPWVYIGVLVLFLLLAINLLVLDYEVLIRNNYPSLSTISDKFGLSGEIDLSLDQGVVEPKIDSVTDERKPQVSGETTTSSSDCPQACLDEIAKSVSRSTVASTGLKEIYIPLGSGSTSSQTWEEIGGLEAVIDLANYPPIEFIMFEASMRIPTANGRVYAKLYDVIEKHDAWNSTVYAEGSDGYRAESGNVIFSPGRKLYRVKMRSTMGYEAILDSARIKILLK